MPSRLTGIAHLPIAVAACAVCWSSSCWLLLARMLAVAGMHAVAAAAVASPCAAGCVRGALWCRDTLLLCPRIGDPRPPAVRIGCVLVRSASPSDAAVMPEVA
jgi:hypothetical protein